MDSDASDGGTARRYSWSYSWRERVKQREGVNKPLLPNVRRGTVYKGQGCIRRIPTSTLTATLLGLNQQSFTTERNVQLEMINTFREIRRSKGRNPGGCK